MSKEKLEFDISAAEELYIFALPLVASEMVHRDYPNDHIKHDRVYPTKQTAKFGRPNRDTLYSAGFLQLADTPYTLEIPKIENRYFLFPFFSAYGDVVDSLGTKSGRFGKFLLLKEDQEKPSGYEEYETITFRESLIGYLMRVETKGEEDYVNAHNIQDKVILTPLNKENLEENAFKPDGVDPIVYAKSLSDKDFFELYVKLLKDNPALDDRAYEILSLINYDRESGSFDYDSLDEEQKNILAEGRKSAEKNLNETDGLNEKMKFDGTWVAVLGGVGTYGTDHIARARVMGSPGGWGTNIPSECIYFDAQIDSNGSYLDPNKNYKIHFEDKGLPHAGAFWSLAVYGSDTGDVTSSANGIYSLNSNDLALEILKTNEDGSLDIYIGPDKPEEYFINNWIETIYPNDKRLSLNIRVYVPDEITQEGLWVTPKIIENSRES